MTLSDQKLKQVCQLYPKTLSHLKQRGLERRDFFISCCRNFNQHSNVLLDKTTNIRSSLHQRITINPEQVSFLPVEIGKAQHRTQTIIQNLQKVKTKQLEFDLAKLKTRVKSLNQDIEVGNVILQRIAPPRKDEGYSSSTDSDSDFDSQQEQLTFLQKVQRKKEQAFDVKKIGKQHKQIQFRCKVSSKSLLSNYATMRGSSRIEQQ